MSGRVPPSRPGQPFNIENFAELERLLRNLETGSGAVPVVSALPANPVDGQVINYLASAELGVIWQFRYREASTSAHKWEFVGGGWLWSNNEANLKITLANKEFVYQQLAVTPEVTAPLPGDYEIQFGCTFVQCQVIPEGVGFQLNYGLGQVGGGIFDALPALAHSQFDFGTPWRSRVFTNLATGTQCRIFVAGNTLVANSWSTQTPSIMMRPIRVG